MAEKISNDQIDRILQNAESKGATITRTYDAPKTTASDAAADYAKFSEAFDKGEVNIFGEVNSKSDKLEQLAYIRDFAK